MMQFYFVYAGKAGRAETKAIHAWCTWGDAATVRKTLGSALEMVSYEMVSYAILGLYFPAILFLCKYLTEGQKAKSKSFAFIQKQILQSL